jgi:hypothetical protein
MQHRTPVGADDDRVDDVGEEDEGEPLERVVEHDVAKSDSGNRDEHTEQHHPGIGAEACQ